MSSVETRVFTLCELEEIANTEELMLPREQRTLAWSDADRKAFVATLLKYGHSLTSISMQIEHDATGKRFVLWDGHNRVSAVLRFLRHPLLYMQEPLKLSEQTFAVDAPPFDTTTFDTIANIASVADFSLSCSFANLLENVRAAHTSCNATQTTVALLIEELAKVPPKSAKHKLLDDWCRKVNSHLRFKTPSGSFRSIMDAVVDARIYNNISAHEIPALMGIVNKAGVHMNDVQLLATTLCRQIVDIPAALDHTLRGHLFRYYATKAAASALSVVPKHRFSPETRINAFEFLIALSSEFAHRYRSSGWPIGAYILEATSNSGAGAPPESHKRRRDVVEATDNADEDDSDEDESSDELHESTHQGCGVVATSESLLQLQEERPKEKHMEHQQFVFSLWRDAHGIHGDDEKRFVNSFTTTKTRVFDFYNKLVAACDAVANATSWLTSIMPRITPSPRTYSTLLLSSMKGADKSTLQRMHIACGMQASEVLKNGTLIAATMREHCMHIIKHSSKCPNRKQTRRRLLKTSEAFLLGAFCYQRLTRQELDTWREHDHIFPFTSDFKGYIDISHVGNIMMLAKELNNNKGKRLLHECGTFNKLAASERKHIIDRQLHPSPAECAAVWEHESITNNDEYVRFVETRAQVMLGSLMTIYEHGTR